MVLDISHLTQSDEAFVSQHVLEAISCKLTVEAHSVTCPAITLQKGDWDTRDETYLLTFHHIFFSIERH